MPTDRTAPETENDIENVIAKTIEYLAIPCVVGHEQHFLNYLYDDFSKLGLETIRHDGLLEIHGKKPRSAIICAHIDRHGLISIGHGEYVYAAQYMKEIKYGQNNRHSEKEIEKITRRFEGERVYGYDPETGRALGAGVIRTCDPWLMKGDALFRVDGLENIPLGFPVAYARTARVETGLFKGQLDNAISLGAIYELFKNGFAGTALFTIEEEIGKSWVHLVSWLKTHGVQTRDLLVIDTSPFMDAEPLDEGLIIFRNRDMSATFNAGLTAQLKKRAETLKIPFRTKDEILLSQGKTTEQLGSTELGKLILHTGGTWSGATVQIPTIMFHTSNETTSLPAIGNYYAFLKNILVEEPLSCDIALSAPMHAEA